ncbi:MAG: isoleucine--tRNA ligase [Holosporales bacterium]|jgi:isoleucyl-tRNA synthetase|nr:isoleucine--tRNA ligase [Holosporales bacterium]
MEESNQKRQLRDTVFLPRTDFPMKGNLASQEPSILAKWREIGLFKKLREKSAGREKFILHFGPPYANGHTHIGHSLIGVLKDAVNKSYQMLGYDAPLVIGWDCHGLPIEWKIEENYLKNGKKRDEIPVLEFLSKCREFAAMWSSIQKEEFSRLGIVFDEENPYSTMDKKSEAIICEKFFEIYKKGLVYKGKKPIMWSVVERTALAEAELEYKDKVSDAIYVKFPIRKTNEKGLDGVCAVIWTTTPWTIPANKAIAYSENFSYSVVKANDEKYLIAKELVSQFVNDVGLSEYEVIGNINGEKLKGTVCEHPLKAIGYTLEVPMLPGSHVTIDAGVGLVHTAPAHGLEDFALGSEYGLEIEDIVNDDGTIVSSLPLFGGIHVFKVGQNVIDELRKSGTLIHASQIVHSYPHSWRSKAPLIFKTTGQWFISIGKIRNKLLAAIDETKWYPSGYENRIRSMVEKRPDWCISRQRKWGVPIALFLHNTTGDVLVDDRVFANVLKSIEEEGLEAWHSHDVSYFLDGTGYNPDNYSKVVDTLEVWFESACSHHYVLEERDYLQWPADLYFEGSDQHRGWFQSSLVESVCLNGRAPYNEVATNGFVLDQNGKKMSKSLGNVVSPQDVTEKYGSDILRLWCLTADYSEDTRIGEEILKRNMDVYRRYRNTLRYLLGVLCEYDENNKLDYSALPELEKLILHNLFELNQLMIKCIKSYSLQIFYTQLHTFCSNTLSSFYFDIRKDCIYCDSKDNSTRNSCIAVMNQIFICLVHWLAPALSFTAEEAWQHYKLNSGSASIHLNDFPKIPDEWRDEGLFNKWEIVKNARKSITAALEIERSAKTIGSGLEAKIYIYSSNPNITKILLSVNIAEIAIVSEANIITAQIPSNANVINEDDDIGVVVKKANGAKCDRCWKILENVSSGTSSEFGNLSLCKRCQNAIEKVP